MDFGTLARAATDPRIKDFLFRQAALAERHEAPGLVVDVPAVPAAPAAGGDLAAAAVAIGELDARLGQVEAKRAIDGFSLTDSGAARLGEIMQQRNLGARDALAVLEREHPEPAEITRGTYTLSSSASTARAEPAAEEAIGLLLEGRDDEFLSRTIGTAGRSSIW